MAKKRYIATRRAAVIVATSRRLRAARPLAAFHGYVCRALQATFSPRAGFGGPLLYVTT